jgi:hypothetical protein
MVTASLIEYLVSGTSQHMHVVPFVTLLCGQMAGHTRVLTWLDIRESSAVTDG